MAAEKSKQRTGKKKKSMQRPDIYISPNELAVRWRCSRSSADRYARAGNVKKLFLGQGKNGGVRYVLQDVVDFEKKRIV